MDEKLTVNTEENTNVETSAETKNTETKTVENKVPYERFKEKVDEVNKLKARLAALEKEREEAEKRKLEEQNEYKKLYEKAQKELEQFKIQTLNAKKTLCLRKPAILTNKSQYCAIHSQVKLTKNSKNHSNN